MGSGLNSGRGRRKVEVAVAGHPLRGLVSGMSDVYAPHLDFIRPAQAVTHPRYIMIVSGVFLTAFFVIPVVLVGFLPQSAQIALYDSVSPGATLAQFGIFGAAAWVFVRTLRRVHGRGFFSLIGAYQSAWHDFRKTVVAVGALLFLVQVILPLGSWGEPAQVRNMAVWVALLPVAILAILIQVTTEEMVFRGYLQQQFACLSASPLVWMVLPSVMFGLWHYWNANSFAEGIVYVFWAALLGLACADLTARTGNLGGATGLHFANNFVAIMFIATEGWPMSGLALVLYPYQDPDVLSAEIAQVMGLWMGFSMMISALSVLIMWLAARISLKR